MNTKQRLSRSGRPPLGVRPLDPPSALTQEEKGSKLPKTGRRILAVIGVSAFVFVWVYFLFVLPLSEDQTKPVPTLNR